MKKAILEFNEKFNYIKSLGYIKAINNNFSGMGLTFEKLLGKSVDDFPLPDFQNTIEIKTKLLSSKKPIHLFRLTPDGEDFVEIKRILKLYGYYSSNSKDNKMFNGAVYANKTKKIGLDYYFSLNIDYHEKQINLLVFNKNKELIDKTSYWTFEKIENALCRKIKYLALVFAVMTKKGEDKYYKYETYRLYKYSDINTFLFLLSKGIISINFSIGIFKGEYRHGQIHDHGTAFDIHVEDLDKLFLRII